MMFAAETRKSAKYFKLKNLLKYTSRNIKLKTVKLPLSQPTNRVVSDIIVSN